MSAQPIEDSLGARELIAVLAERVSGMKETTDEFRVETRKAFDEAKTAIHELRTEVKTDSESIRSEMRAQFAQHNARISTLENARSAAAGGIKVGKWLWAASIAMGGLVMALVGMLIR